MTENIRGFREGLIFDDEFTMSPELFREVVDGFASTQMMNRINLIKEKGAYPFYLEEIALRDSIPDGKAYYDHVFGIGLDRSNPKNSYVAYATGNVDEIDFTRPCQFTSEATALPDIDTDFPTDYRESAIQYVRDKYGDDRVCQIVTFGRLSGRSALKAVLRTAELCDPYTQNAMTEHIPDEAAISDQLEAMEEPSILMWALEHVKELRDYAYLEDGQILGDYAEAFKKALKLEGTFQTIGKHAAGVIISSERISDLAPMCPAKDGTSVAALDMGDLEKVGLVKFDFLGVDILNKISAVMGADILSAPLDDEETWSLIQSGNTKGFFQLEGKLGMDWSKELRPDSIKELAALVSVIRPGSLQAKSEDGRSMTKVYCERKNGIEEVPKTKINETIDTYGVLIFQETLLKICKELAGFNSADSIKMMKSVGKKNAKLLFSLENKFLEGCKRVNSINESEAKTLFDTIKKSSRYLFNASHAVSYAYLGYWSAFTKRSKPLEFYKEWLETSDHKLDPHAEVKNLVLSARMDDYEIEPPSVKYLTKGFFIKDGRVYFGLSHIKGSSSKELDKLFVLLTEHGVVLSIPSLLFDVLPHINKRTCEALINSGAFGYLGTSRAKLLHWYTCSNMFTAKELEFFGNKSFQSFEDAILSSAKLKKEGGCVSTSARLLKVSQIVEVVLNPGRSLEDTPARIAALEEDLMGIPLSCGYMDACLATGTADATCRDFKRGRTGRMSLNVRVKEVKEHVLKDDNKMCFLTVEDDSGELDNLVLFKDEYKKFGGLLYPGAFVALFGEKSKTKNSLVVSRVAEL